MMRSIDWAELLVWRVEKTRWPVSAAVMTVWIVAQSRISPTMMTSGSCRIMFLSASRNAGVSVPTSRCETEPRASMKRYSMGSSIVTTWTARFSVTDRMIEASVVDLPDPVGPVMRTRPAGMWLNVSRTSGRPRVAMSGMLKEIRRKTPATDPRWM